MDNRDYVIAGLLMIVIVLLVINLIRTRVSSKPVITPGGNAVVIYDRPYYYTNPVSMYTTLAGWPYGYGSGGYSGGTRSSAD